MKKTLLAMVCSALPLFASAQYMGTLPPVIDGDVYYSTDSDKFDSRTMWTGINFSNGFGVRIGDVKYTSPTIDASGKTLQGTYIDVGENHSFHGAIGIKRLSHTTNLATTGEDLANKIITNKIGLGLSDSDIVDIRRDAPGWAKENIEADGGTVAGERDVIFGNAELKLLMTDSLTIGVAINRDVVDSAYSLQNGIEFTTYSADLDLLLTEELTFTSIVGLTKYSDGNDRMFVKNKLIWSFAPEYGISTYAKLIYQRDSKGGSIYYTSPDSANEIALGLQLRRPNNGLVYTAALEVGYNTENFATESISSKTYLWLLGVQTNPGRKTGVTYGASILGTTKINSSTYSWTGVNGWIKVPF